MKSRRDKQALSLKKVVQKYSKVRIRGCDSLKAEVRIKNLRIYNQNYNNQVDIEFSGKFLGRSRGQSFWVEKKDLPKYSKIKVNRFIRKLVLPYIRTHLSYFGVDIVNYYNIKKIVWV